MRCSASRSCDLRRLEIVSISPPSVRTGGNRKPFWGGFRTRHAREEGHPQSLLERITKRAIQRGLAQRAGAQDLVKNALIRIESDSATLTPAER